jgi:glycolate oxidase FAD binding subunit
MPRLRISRPMAFADDRLAQRLEAALGADTINREANLLAAHNIDGEQPALLCFPETSEQVTTAMRICSEADAAVVAWGGGTAMQIGNPPRNVNVVLGLGRLNRVVEHDDANLTVTVEAGIGLSRVQQTVAVRKQFLAFNPPYADRATVGGVIATNLNGPRRSYYGSVRDLVIGMKVVLASGERIKAGGKVVKNVAGYDMCKLFVGSLGTLGIITEATLRMGPIPETAATVVATGTLPLVWQLADALSRSKLLPSAVFLLSPEADQADDLDQGGWHFAVCCEGFEKNVARHLHDVQDTATRIGLGTEILKASDHSGFWDEVCDFPLQAGRLVYRVTVPRASTLAIIQMIHRWPTMDFRPWIVSDTAVGIIWLSLDAKQDAIKWFAKLVAEAREHRGHAVMLAAPTNLKADVDVWGPAPPALSLMREIKRQFDPKNLLTPGRFIGGI